MPEFDLFLKTDAHEELAHALATIVASEEFVATGKIGSEVDCAGISRCRIAIGLLREHAHLDSWFSGGQSTRRFRYRQGG